MKFKFRTLSLLAALALCAAAQAQDYQLGELKVTQPFARATAPGQPAGGAYLNIENRGGKDDRLLSASSPVAKSVEIHTMTMENNVMKMRALPALELKAGSKLEMRPGQGYHIMLIGLQQPLKAGQSFPLTLNFEKAGKLEVAVKVEEMGQMPAGHGAGHAK